jgi:hypothetical protein
MGEAFIDWLEDEVDAFFEKAGYCMKAAVVLIFAIVTLPAWIVPFLYWYFAVWKKAEEGICCRTCQYYYEEYGMELCKKHEEPQEDTLHSACTDYVKVCDIEYEGE